MSQQIFALEEVLRLVPVERDFVLHCVELEWVHPARRDPVELDEADLARIRLILDLRRTFGVNDESMDLVLHLLDQLHTMHGRLSRIGND